MQRGRLTLPNVLFVYSTEDNMCVGVEPAIASAARALKEFRHLSCDSPSSARVSLTKPSVRDAFLACVPAL